MADMLSACWRLWLVGLGVLTGCTAIAIVKQLSSCSVQTDQGVIDLTPLALTTGGPRYDNIYAYPDEYSWNPCVDYKEPGDLGTAEGCGKIAACQNHASGLYGLGTQASASFLINSQGQIEIQYKSAYGGRTAHVQLQCVGTQSTTTVTASGEQIPDNYYFTVSGNITCPVMTANTNPGNDGGGITFGSVLVIIFFTIVVFYLVLGSLYMRFRKNATGKDIIPNYSVWVRLFSSAKDGAIFVIGRKRSNYESL